MHLISATPRRDGVQPAALGRRAGLVRVVGRDGLLWPALLAPLAAAVMLRALSGPVVDPDYWWHLATGRWMLTHGRVPTTDPFSYTHGGQSWYAHEWLAELVIALLDKAAGYAAVLLLTAAVTGCAVWLLWRTASYYGAGRRAAFGATVIGGAFLVNYLEVRPQVWGFALLALLLHELAAHDTGHRRRLWHLPLLFALWINIHLSALTGGGVVALYVLHRAVRWLAAEPGPRAAERERFTHVFLAAAASAGALLLNPRGPALLWFTRIYLMPGAARYRYIQEWQPLKPTPFNLVLIAIGALILVSAVLSMLRRRTLWPSLPALVLAPFALHAARYTPVFGLAAAGAAGWVLASVQARSAARRGPASEPVRLTLPFALAVVAMSVVCGAAAARAGGQFRRTPDAAASRYPVEATAWLKSNLPGARLFNEYDWGGYLIDAMYPARAVYIDGREEMYGERYLGRYLSALHLEPGWQGTLAGSGADAVLLERDGKLAGALRSDSSWRLVFEDPEADVFVPAGSEWTAGGSN